MTQEQQLATVYKKLFNQKTSTKSGAKFFEEPISTYSQVNLDYVYANSNYIPSVAPKTNVVVNGVNTVVYVEKERCIPIDSSGTRFKTGNGKIIPLSFGTGYGISMYTPDGIPISFDEFPYIIDWEFGEITFDYTPYDIDFYEPPLVTYYYYSGQTLQTISTFTSQGPRGDFGPTGQTGPVDSSVLSYRGKTDFTVIPAIQYQPNDVITFTTNGNSYICVLATNQSPIASPSSWENISPAGAGGQLPENVFYVNHPNAIPTSNLTNGAPNHFTSLKDAIDAAPEEIEITIIVNQLNNAEPIIDENITVNNKLLNIIFRKWANVATDLELTDFNFSVVDSQVVIQNAQIGGDKFFLRSNLENTVTVQSITKPSSISFLDSKINAKLLQGISQNANEASLIFERCSINTDKIITNSTLIIGDSTYSGSITCDYSQQETIGSSHVFNVVNSFGFQRLTQTSPRNIPAYDIVVLVDRNDIQNLSVKLENSIVPGFGVVLTPRVFVNTPDIVSIDVNNCTLYAAGLDSDSAEQRGRLNMVGSNVVYALNNIEFTSRYFTIDAPFTIKESTFLFSLEDGGVQIPVVFWDNNATQLIRPEPYQILSENEIETLMLSV